ARNNTLLQFQADLLGIPVVRPAITETTSLGAAYLAGLSVGFWKDMSEIEGQWKAERTFEPQKSKDEMQNMQSRWQEALNRSRDWADSPKGKGRQ
ncbi:MAG: glycerol kinase, partial [Acidobacteriaceae bacterium]|nr:glycerol kinase [Acidobacteriaceae bacterium]